MRTEHEPSESRGIEGWVRKTVAPFPDENIYAFLGDPLSGAPFKFSALAVKTIVEYNI